MSHRTRREVEQLANVEERKWPATIIRREPAICVEVKFLFDFAGRTMKPAQILRGLFKDSGRQVSLICLGCVIVGKVHIVSDVGFWLFSLSQVFEDRHFRKFEISWPNPGFVGGSWRTQSNRNGTGG
jgi:hypothetical protein